MSKQRAASMGASLLAGFAAAALVAAPAVADDVTVTNTETVQAYLDATGKLDVARIYDQIAMQGKGTVELANPVSTEGLRNLDQFGGFDVENGEIVGTYDVDGEMRLRSVSDFTQKLPLEVSVTYVLDGKEVAPADVVGKTGTLEVRYVVRNVTGKPTEIKYDDGTGVPVITTEDVVIPMVGSLSTVLPPSFTDVSSQQANMAGDGRGGTKMSFTMTLFGPIGAPEATFGYTASVANAIIPPATISALPVSPLESPSFKGGAASYQSGATTGVALTAGAAEIDANLLRLRDGAGELLAGLIKLSNGAAQLNAGLTGTAAPGAAQLADGADQAAAGADELSSGLDELDDGANKLSDGANQVADGADTAAAGADELADGSAQVADGLDQAGAQAPALIDGLAQVADGLEAVDAGLVKLYGGIGNLPAQAKPLHDGITQMLTGLGDTTTPGTLIYGVNAVRSGLAGAVATGGSVDQLKGGVDLVNEGLTAALASGGDVDLIEAAILNIANVPSCAGDPVCVGTVGATAANIESQLRSKLGTATGGLTQVSGGLSQLKTSLSDAAAALVLVQCGLNNTTLPQCDSAKPGLVQGLSAVDVGITQLVNGVVKSVQDAIGDDNDTKADNTLRGGIHSLEDGVDQLATGGVALIIGLDQLSEGASLVAEGNAELAGGLGELSDGATQVADGSDQLADGTNQAAEGSDKLAAGNELLAVGANKLASGLSDAADGSSQLAAGLSTAAEGAPALEDGAQRLSDEGTQKLIEAGKSTAADYGAKYAMIEAGAERAQTESMAYGAPEGAVGATAYSIELAGVDSASTRNVGRLLAAAVLFGLAAGAVYLRRRTV